MAFPERTCAVLALALASPIPVSGDDLGAEYAGPVDFPWAIGKSWTDPAPRPGPWTPWPTDDPVIWAADACLGFYLTRDRAAFAPALPYEIVHKDLERRLYAERDDPPVRVSVFNWPAPHHGVFQCQTMTWPALAKPDPEAVTVWAEA